MQALIAMERFTLKGHTRVDVQAWGGADMQAESLSEALPLLQASAYTAGTRLTLTDMTISPALTEVLTAAAAAGWRLDVSCDQWLAGPADAPPPPLPALAALRLQMPLTDYTLACIVLSAAAGIEHLHVPKAKLDRLRQIPTSIALPWQALTVGDVELCVPVTYNVQESIERSPEYHIGTLHLSLAREQVRWHGNTACPFIHMACFLAPCNWGTCILSTICMPQLSSHAHLDQGHGGERVCTSVCDRSLTCSNRLVCLACYRLSLAISKP